VIKITQHSFAGGQLDRALLGGRQDIQKYYTGASLVNNYVVKRQGCVSKRQGTDRLFDATAKLSTTVEDATQQVEAYRLIPFVFEKDYGYAILLTPGFITIYAEGEAVQDIASPYAVTEINELAYCQSGDILYLASKYHVPQKLIRAADGTFSLSEITFANSLPVPAIGSLVVTSPTAGTADRTIAYCATAVFDTGESLPSAPAEVSYKSPWASGMIIKATVTAVSPTPMYYNIYKKTQNYYGLIGSTMLERMKLSASASAATVTEKTVNATNIKLWMQPLWDTDDECKSVFSNTEMVQWGYKRGAVVVLSGDLVLTLTTPVNFNKIRLGLGYCTSRQYLRHRWEQYKTYTSYKTTLYATKARKHSVVITFESGDPVTIDSALFDQINGGASIDEVIHLPANASGTWDAYGDAPRADYETAAYNTMISRSHKIELDIDMPAGETRKATSITIKGYTDNAKTVPCTGDISYATTTRMDYQNRYPEYIYTPTITGNPMIINAVELYVVGGAVLTFTDDYITPNVAITPPKQTELFKADGELPGLVTLYQQRLMFAASLKSPSKYWLSRPGEFENFSSSDVITETDPIIAALPLTKGPRINHIIAQRDVHLFCEGSEWLLKPTSSNALSYKTIVTQMQSAAGCAEWLPPVPCGTSLLFVEKSGRSVREYKYDYANDGFAGRDISIVSASLFEGRRIIGWAFQQHPDSILWCVMSDGGMLGFTYMPEHEVYAWFKADLTDAQVLAICGTDALIGYGLDETSEVYLLVKRGTSYFIERMRPVAPSETLVSRVLHLDSVREITAGQAEAIPANHIAINKATGVQATQLTQGVVYILGVLVIAEIQTVHPEIEQGSTIQQTAKAIVSIGLRVQDAEGLKVRIGTQASSKGIPVRDCEETVAAAVSPATEATVALASGDFEIMPTQQNSTDARVTIRSEGPFGSTILSVSTVLSIQNLDGSEG